MNEPDYPSERLRQAQRLIDRLLEDPALRAAFRRDPEGTAIRLGVEFEDVTPTADHRIVPLGSDA